jgi:AMMECR1 domain-containing protein
MTTDFDDKDRKELLRIARATLREYLSTGYLPPGSPHRKSLLDPSGAAVTLTVDGAVRGRAVSVDADRPLYVAVEELAVAAATRDVRGEPVRLEDLPRVRVQVAVVKALTEVGADAVSPGVGLSLTRGPRRGVVLPEESSGWARERLLDEACWRAALPAGAWREAQLHRFDLEIFDEEI